MKITIERNDYIMKKMFSLVLSVILAASLLTGCGTKDTKSEEIVIVTREEGSGTRGAFVELTGIEEKGTDSTKVDRTSKEAITQMKTDTVLTTVAGNKSAIGYVSTGSLNDTVKTLNINGISPTSENIKDGSYKISRPFNIAIKNETSELAQDFIDFIMSKEGQVIVAKSYIAVDNNLASYSGSKPSGKIVVAGSSSVSPVMEKLREAYIAINTNAEIEIQQSDSSAGMKATIDGTADIGMASRSLKDSEKEQIKDIAIALDGIAVITHKENNITDLTVENVKKIFVGEIINWSEIIK